MASNLSLVEEHMLSVRNTFEDVAVDRGIVFERELEFAMQIMGGNKYLQSVALGNPDSIKDAIVNVSAIGISLNPALKQAYLVPRKKRICLDISYMGMIDLCTSTGAIRWAQAEVVHRGDLFRRNGVDLAPTHEYEPFSEHRESEAIVGAYACAKTADGDVLTHPMSIARIYSIRDRSEAWKAYERDRTKRCPWNTDEVEMIKKTVIKQAQRTWPRNDRLNKAIHLLNTDSEEGIAFDRDEALAPSVGKPAVSMPQERKPAADVTDVEPKQRAAVPENSPPATDGEIAYMQKRIERKGMTIADAREAAGLKPATTLNGLTKAGFVALQEATR